MTGNLNSENIEDVIARETAKWAAGKTASDRLGRPLTRDEQASYDSMVDSGLAVSRLVQRILKL